jgi:hypothetical protein
VDTIDIVSINTLRDAASIRIGMDLMIPGAMKRSVAVIESPKTLPTKVALAKGATQIKDTNIVQIAPPVPQVIISSKTGLKDRYAVKYTGKSR